MKKIYLFQTISEDLDTKKQIEIFHLFLMRVKNATFISGALSGRIKS